MSANTKIEWADHTFNPWIGCTKVGPGCDHCYAEAREDKRLHRVQWGAGQPRQRTKTWGDPVRWNKQHGAFFAEQGRRQRVFCASLADVFDNEVDPVWRADIFRLIRETPHLDWLLLTKRIGNAQTMIDEARDADAKGPVWPWPNVWLGATVVNQAEADRDIPKLLAVPARVRFLSIEPMLGPIDLGAWIGDEDCHPCGARFWGDHLNQRGLKAVDFEEEPEDENDVRRVCPDCRAVDISGEVGPVADGDHESLLHWVIAGGESGHGARPAHPDWFRGLRDQCAAAGVPFLFKQWGEWAPPSKAEDLRFLGDAMRVGKAVHVYGDGREPDGRFRKGDDHLLRIGKKLAGRLLDGVEHNGFPA